MLTSGYIMPLDFGHHVHTEDTLDCIGLFAILLKSSKRGNIW